MQSTGDADPRVDWCQSAALLVRRAAAEQVGYLDPDFFVYSDEVDFARRLRDAGWHSVYVPGAVAIHHEQLSTDAVPERRIVELARNRDLYMRKHHSPAAARAVRWLTAWTYALRALAALVLPGHSPRRYWRHVTATLHPERGEGLREAAAEYNRTAVLSAFQKIGVGCVPDAGWTAVRSEALLRQLAHSATTTRRRAACPRRARAPRAPPQRCAPDGTGGR